MLNKKIVCVVNDTVLPESGLKSEHGLSMWIEGPQGVALWDSGGSGEVLRHNLKALGLDPGRIQALALSHAHDDHTGGLDYLLQVNPDLPVYAHPDIFQPRFSRKNGEYRSMGLPERCAVLKNAPNLRLNDLPILLMPGLWTSGKIRERKELEGRSANHFIRMDEDWHADPYRDDMSLILEVSGGIILICGCCHAGLLNTLRQVKQRFNQPVKAVLGGTHLISADGAAVRHVIRVLKDEFPGTCYYLNHCSGEDVIQRMEEAFVGCVKRFPAGTWLEINEDGLFYCK
jgi:7,8-dihydropterin-6-yl-methyl-4-(beta-D-ribofuranosyl)aminobenzene 5'-phosphate synthase